MHNILHEVCNTLLSDKLLEELAKLWADRSLNMLKVVGKAREVEMFGNLRVSNAFATTTHRKLKISSLDITPL